MDNETLNIYHIRRAILAPHVHKIIVIIKIIRSRLSNTYIQLQGNNTKGIRLKKVTNNRKVMALYNKNSNSFEKYK